MESASLLIVKVTDGRNNAAMRGIMRGRAEEWRAEECREREARGVGVEGGAPDDGR